ncbi:OstA family protein [Oleidesulfovibrio alaskensis G20]|uniref:OstA family protein n=1 Tax=Oleidesulfovibrio alaskensis (strain ATCC BAA-1058 / DSM 17464 / G20) TaxID=207559 RepID=Q310T0_OLEA2|nr:LptA/OstA family protein [Oleidesulfovibrio alaskensis]ABB38566.1 OstA family protein [Oleidesulfovibrio alaskensis G20]MBG0774609.1 organic solvent tolerance protein OstA [Oleidesulfovibrio alaskensis]
MNRISITGHMIMVLLACLVLQAAPATAAEDIPTSITSKTMTYDANAQLIIFEQDVYVQRGEFELWADSISVYLDKNASAAAKQNDAEGPAIDAGQINRLVAEGNVRMKQLTKSGECRKATYKVSEGLLVMEGDPVLRDEGNSIGGQEIRFYVNENRSEVLGAPGKPVNAVFSAPKRMKK